MGETVKLDGEHLTRDDVVAVARTGAPVTVAESAYEVVVDSRQVIERLVTDEKRVYGVTTGFGSLSNVTISLDDTRQLQINLIRSHATAVGEPLPTETVRAVMLLRANSLLKGYSGVRPEFVDALIALLNAGVHPVVPCQGSLGASGDLAPLAHIGLVLIGEGEAEYRGERLPGGEALRRSGCRPLALEAKEALALINGTPVMTAIGALASHDTALLLDALTCGAALTMEALQARTEPLAPALHAARPHPGQVAIADRLRQILAGSANLAVPNQRARVQDPYSVRCVPQVMGPCWEAERYVASVLTTEINSVTDNPLCILETEETISGGNFHGHPVALALDFLKIAVASAANMAERRCFLLLNPELSGLPPSLTAKPGLNSGLMITQYVAASLVAENKVLAHPTSVDSIPSSAGIEDYNSLGTHAARHLARVVENSLRVAAIELLCAAQGVDLLRQSTPLELAPATAAIHRAIRSVSPYVDQDRSLHADIDEVVGLIRRGALRDAADASLAAVPAREEVIS